MNGAIFAIVRPVVCFRYVLSPSWRALFPLREALFPLRKALFSVLELSLEGGEEAPLLGEGEGPSAAALRRAWGPFLEGNSPGLPNGVLDNGQLNPYQSSAFLAT